MTEEQLNQGQEIMRQLKYLEEHRGEIADAKDFDRPTVGAQRWIDVLFFDKVDYLSKVDKKLVELRGEMGNLACSST